VDTWIREVNDGTFRFIFDSENPIFKDLKLMMRSL